MHEIPDVVCRSNAEEFYMKSQEQPIFDQFVIFKKNQNQGRSINGNLSSTY
jgi:hypothetical protein